MTASGNHIDYFSMHFCILNYGLRIKKRTNYTLDRVHEMVHGYVKTNLAQKDQSCTLELILRNIKEFA